MSKRWLPSVKKSPNLTLLERAQAFKQANPQTWQENKEEIHDDIEEENVLPRPSSYIEEYYEEMVEIKKEKDSKANNPASLHLELEYFSNKKSKRKKGSKRRNLSIFIEREITVKKSKNLFSDCCGCGKTKTETPELQITIFEGHRLINVLAQGVPILRRCQLKCFIYSNENEKPIKILKTNFELCTLDGTSDWFYKFILQGFTEEELNALYVVIEVVGTNRHREKLSVGHVLLAGKQARIRFGLNRAPRAPSEEESRYWKSALEKPGRPIGANVNLERFAKTGFGSTLISMLTKEANGSNLIGFRAG